MKKILFLSTIVVMMILSSCKKAATENIANTSPANHVLVPAPANAASTISVLHASDPGGDIMNEPFNSNFLISVPDPNNVFEKQPVTLVSRSMDVVKYVWKIDDVKITDMNPTLSFPWHGNYHITLTVTDRNGNTATSSKDLTILCTFMH